MMVFPIVGCWHFPILESWGLLLLQNTLFWSQAPIQANTRGDDQNINTPLWTDKCSSAFCNWSFFMLEWTGLFLSSNEGRKFRPPDTSRWMYLKCTFLKWRLKGCIFTPGFNSHGMVLAKKPATPCNSWRRFESLYGVLKYVFVSVLPQLTASSESCHTSKCLLVTSATLVASVSTLYHLLKHNWAWSTATLIDA